MTTPDDFITAKLPGVTPVVPDQPQTFLAFRVWRLDRARLTILSLNAPFFRAERMNPITVALADEPEGGWPPDKLLRAKCENPKSSGRLPHPDPDTCGIYATTSMDVIDSYLNKDAPVLGVVELGGRVIPAKLGFRAASARLAAVLLVDEVLTMPHRKLRALAERYQVPALVPHSLVAEDYRSRLAAPSVSLADEIEQFLRDNGPTGLSR